MSSDEVNPPILTLEGGGVLTDGLILVTPLAAPPAKVRVLSSAGGVGELRVNTGFGAVVGGIIPIAANDTHTVLEDSAAAPINVLANDTVLGAPIVFGPNVTVALVNAPTLGIAAVNPDGTINYTPNPNAFGADAITYTVTVDANISSPGNVAITITPVNDPPIGVPDTFNVVANVPASLNVLQNDTDLDGHADIINAVIATPPEAGATATGGPQVSFNATAGGTFTFTYNAQDSAAVLSEPTLVTVNVLASENIVVVSALFRTNQSRWIIDGTDNLVAGQTLTIAYDDGVLTNGASAAGTQIGTAVVDALGAWLLDIRDAAGVLNPTNFAAFQLLPTRIRVTSTFGGTTTANITIGN